MLEVHARLSRLFPGLITAIAPRHPERGEALARLSGGARRSMGAGPPDGGGIWIADTMGEMGLLYRTFRVVVMGKSFGGGKAEAGGQNPWEPACLGCAVAIGPDHGNFGSVVRALQAAGAIHVAAGRAG